MNYEAVISQKDAQITELTQTIEDLKHRLDMFQKLVFGQKSEKHIPTEDPNQLNLFNLPVDAENPYIETATEAVSYTRNKTKTTPKGRQLLSNCQHLDVEMIFIPVEHAENDIHIGDEITERLAKKPGHLFIKRFIRPKYKKAKDSSIIIAPPIQEPIAKCEGDVTLLADIVVSKFVDHQPEYRQQQIYKRQGVIIAPSTMNGWVHQLAPLMKLMAQYIKTQILISKYLQKDESTIKVLNEKKGKAHTGYMWVMVGHPNKYVYFQYQQGRDRAGPLEILKGYSGIMQTDAYEVYDIIDKVYENIIHFHCWAHARRKFIEAINNDKKRSEYALEQIRKLYAIERECREKEYTIEQRKEARKESKEILQSLKTWLDIESLKVTPRSPIGKAMAYLIPRWEKFTKYTDYGEVEIDNNIIENVIRPLALGRKNYLFAGNHNAAANIAYYYTILGTCKALGVNPYDYLVWFLPKVPYIKTSEIGTLAPDAYLKFLSSNT
jgi:transposase